jgi:putative FmdB family regulatory protein
MAALSIPDCPLVETGSSFARWTCRIRAPDALAVKPQQTHERSATMPIYEYLCNRCSNRFELLVAPGAARGNKATCPKCGSKTAKRLFSTFAAHSGASASEAPCEAGRCPSADRCPSGTCPLNR